MGEYFWIALVVFAGFVGFLLLKRRKRSAPADPDTKPGGGRRDPPRDVDKA